MIVVSPLRRRSLTARIALAVGRIQLVPLRWPELRRGAAALAERAVDSTTQTSRLAMNRQVLGPLLPSDSLTHRQPSIMPRRRESRRRLRRLDKATRYMFSSLRVVVDVTVRLLRRMAVRFTRPKQAFEHHGDSGHAFFDRARRLLYQPFVVPRLGADGVLLCRHAERMNGGCRSPGNLGFGDRFGDGDLRIRARTSRLRTPRPGLRREMKSSRRAASSRMSGRTTQRRRLLGL